MLRPGVNRYSLTVGQFRDRDIDLNPWVVQGKYQQGINNYLTGYTGIQASENYTALLLVLLLQHLLVLLHLTLRILRRTLKTSFAVWSKFPFKLQ